MSSGTITERLGHAFGVKEPHVVGSCVSGTHASALMEVCHPNAGDFFTHPLAREDAYLIILHLREVRSCEAWIDRQSLGDLAPPVGATSIFHLAQDFSMHIRGPFHLLMLLLPHGLLKAMAERHGNADFQTLSCVLGRPGDDPVARSLGHCLLPVLHEYSPHRQAFVDYVLMSLGSHLLHRYGSACPPLLTPARGLAPWQQRRAKELMRANLQDGMSLERLAKACRLSPSAFTRAFKQSTGITPYQWFLSRRIEFSMELMNDEEQSLLDIALQAGFADQSHFTRVFTEKVGMSPGVWRSGRVRVEPQRNDAETMLVDLDQTAGS